MAGPGQAGRDWQGDVLGELRANTGPAVNGPYDAGTQASDAGRPYAAPSPLAAPFPSDPAPIPVSVPTVDPVLAPAAGRPRRGDPPLVRTMRTLRRLLASSATGEVAEAARIARELQQPVTTGRQIVVTSIRGGAGKTTVAALLGRTFAHYRHDPVLTVEADAALGTLPLRLGADTVRWNCSELAQIMDASWRLTDITGYLVPTGEGGWLLPGSRGQVGARLDVPTYRSVMVALRRYFSITVVDCETLPGELARTAVDTAHARVIVAPATVEGVSSTRAVLNWMSTLPRPVLPGCVVALSQASPHATIDVAAARGYLGEAGADVVVIPYDRHLAAGGAIQTSMLGSATLSSTTRLAAELLARAVHSGG